MSRLAALTLLFSSAAFAQVLSPLTLTFPSNTETLTFSGADCANRTTLTWQVNLSAQPCNQLKLFVTAASTCPKEPATGDYDLGAETITAGTQGTKTIEFSQLPGFTAADAGVTCGQQAERTWKVCGYFEANSPGSFGFCTTKTDTTDSIPITYDGEPPVAPTLTEAIGVEKGIRVRASATDDASLVRFGARLLGDAAPFNFSTEVAVEGDAAEGRIEGLENGFSYEVVAVAVDPAGNQSAESGSLEATPTETLGFWDAYKRAGGTEDGGCASAPGLFVVTAVMSALWIFRRRRS